MWLPILKLMVILRAVWFRSARRFSEPMTTKFCVMPWDIDENLHLNNARYLNYFEAARWALVTRSKFLKAMLRHGWTTPIGSYRVQYFRPLGIFRCFWVSAQIITWDRESFTFEHLVWARGRNGEKKIMARGLLKQYVKHGRETIEPAKLIAALGLPVEEPPPMTEELRIWHELDSVRPQIKPPAS